LGKQIPALVGIVRSLLTAQGTHCAKTQNVFHYGSSPSIAPSLFPLLRQSHDDYLSVGKYTIERLNWRGAWRALDLPFERELSPFRVCGSVDAGQQVGVSGYISAVAKTDHRILLD
jgi:hypothetical protein